MACYYKCCIVLLIACLTVEASVLDCTYKDPKSGKTFDFSSLISPTGYKFQQQVWQINGFGYDSLSADTQVNLTLYVQVCRNFPTPPPGCSDVGAAYIVTPDGNCSSWGDATVATFDPNPYQDGANLKMYHGTQIDHITFNSGTIYFVCNASRDRMVKIKDESPMFEHVKVANNQAHFKIFTHLAC